MVLMRFSSTQAAEEFYSNYNGRPYSLLEQGEVCQLARVASLEVNGQTVERFIGGQTPSADATQSQQAQQQQQQTGPQASSGAAGREALSSSGGLMELPSCPVCLERLDACVSGLVTTLCNHSFHCACLARWRQHSSCPVCRYSQVPTGENAQRATCAVCGVGHSLWMCLVCGRVGCGRYVQGQHAYAHFLETQHCFALELETQRVWDYVGDGYVHRLLQGLEPHSRQAKLVEARGPSGADKEAKCDALAREYDYLLQTQLDTQRAYFEAQMASTAREHQKQLEKALQQAQRAERERVRLEKALQKAQQANAKLEQENAFLRQLSESLTANQKEYAEQLRQLEARHARLEAEQAARIKDLEESVRDLSFFIEAQKKLEAEAGSEAASAQLEIRLPPPAAPKPSPYRSSRKKLPGKK
jgi:BRCA1-associated protein